MRRTKLTEEECSIIGQIVKLAEEKDEQIDNLIAMAARTTDQTDVLRALAKSDIHSVKIFVYQNPACPADTREQIRERYQEETNDRRPGEVYLFDLAGFDYETGKMSEESYAALTKEISGYKRSLRSAWMIREPGPKLIDFLWRTYKSVDNATYILEKEHHFRKITEETLLSIWNYYSRRAKRENLLNYANFLSFKNCPKKVIEEIIGRIGKDRNRRIKHIIEGSPVLSETTKKALLSARELL